ncbi:MAG: glycoside hydrolase family 97 catalytic domain-containing protein, partial [Bacteroidales bacterium]|nr:glycoside hydrolase family 97 catalytic domain-containing protein [Bacteroidales bacterium]
LELNNGMLLGSNTKVISEKETSVDYTWKPVYGEQNKYRDHYHQLKITLQDKDSDYELDIYFRAYNEGIAFKYIVTNTKQAGELHIKKELSEFSFPGDVKGWLTHSAQGTIVEQPISEITKPVERPLVLRGKNGPYIALGEAGLVDYARMKYISSTEKKNTLVSSLASEVELSIPAATPWRFIMAGDSPGELLENNYLLLNLNAPNELKDVSWIKPGKVIREVSLTTQGGKACIDFAAKHNLQFIEYDAGWYGPEYTEDSDATTITLDPKRSKGPLDLHEVIRYGKEKGVGLILYVNRRALEKQLDDILPLYESWGIKGVKYGFVQVGPQEWTRWLHEAIRKASKHHLMVDIHDEYRPTGYTRTYPNFMTCEGVRGDEESPSNTHTLITMFTRSIAGPADNTNCYYADRVKDKMGSHASQLAKTVCIYSPWQFLYWYDRPIASPGGKKMKEKNAAGLIGDEPELEFFDKVPTVWDEKHVIEGEIGKYGTIARRIGKEWYVGSINGTEAHTLKLSMDFLEKGKKYTAYIYSDDPTINTPTHVKIEKKITTKQSILTFDIKPNNGLAIRIIPDINAEAGINSKVN